MKLKVNFIQSYTSNVTVTLKMFINSTTIISLQYKHPKVCSRHRCHL